MASKFLINSDGKWAVGASGFLVTDASGECPECCGEPVTCLLCENLTSNYLCCFNEGALLDVQLPEVATSTNDQHTLGSCAVLNGLLIEDIPLTTNASGTVLVWSKSFSLGGFDFTIEVGFKCCPGGCFPGSAGWSIDIYHDCGNGNKERMTIDLISDFLCCGGAMQVCDPNDGGDCTDKAQLNMWCECDFPPGVFNKTYVDDTVTITIKNNPCCLCDVDSAATCIASTKEYGADCDANKENICDQFTGDEAECDDAP